MTSLLYTHSDWISLCCAKMQMSFPVSHKLPVEVTMNTAHRDHACSPRSILTRESPDAWLNCTGELIESIAGRLVFNHAVYTWPWLLMRSDAPVIPPDVVRNSWILDFRSIIICIVFTWIPHRGEGTEKIKQKKKTACPHHSEARRMERDGVMERTGDSVSPQRATDGEWW